MIAVANYGTAGAFNGGAVLRAVGGGLAPEHVLRSQQDRCDTRTVYGFSPGDHLEAEGDGRASISSKHCCHHSARGSLTSYHDVSVPNSECAPQGATDKKALNAASARSHVLQKSPAPRFDSHREASGASERRGSSAIRWEYRVRAPMRCINAGEDRSK